MPDIYKAKVYYGTTDVLSDATYLQDLYVTPNAPKPSSNGELVNSTGSLTTLGLQYQENGCFDMCLPYFTDSRADTETLKTRGLSFFRYYSAMAVDTKDLVLNQIYYMFFTTDNSAYFIRRKMKVQATRPFYYDLWSDELCNKSTGSVITSGGVTGMTNIDWNGQNYLSFVSLRVKNSDANYGIQYRVNVHSGAIVSTDNFSYNMNGWTELFSNDTPWVEDPDPYANVGDSDTGGGGGTWDDGSDPVPVPSLPTVGATNTGFISLFVPSQAQLQQVANYLWSSLFDVSTFYKIFENPMDCILGLSVVPVSIPTSGNAQITVGNIELSGITLPLASQQYVEVDCGSLTIEPYFGSYLDYEPYTKMSLFVPYSGVHSVNADDLMGKTVQLVYHIDILTGSLVAFVKCGDSVLYEFNGACGSNIPVNSVNYASTIENAIRIAVNIGTTVATAGASAPATAGGETIRAGQDVARGVTLAGSTAEGILSLKPNIDRAGSLGGTTGLLGNQTPYFIVTRPRLCKPAKQNFYKGYPAFISYTVEDLIGKGYTEWDTIILSTLYLTDDEKNELEGILEGGVYL
jgi:hypothetical protein